MTTLRALLLTIAAALTMAAGPTPVPPPGQAVFFGLHLIEGAGGDPDGTTAARVKMTEELIAADLESRGYTILRPPPEKVAGIRNPVNSNGRDTKIAAEMGADYAVSGVVQKTSNLILAINLAVRDARTGETLRAGTVDLRGDNDESFQRGARYLLKNIIFRTE